MRAGLCVCRTTATCRSTCCTSRRWATCRARWPACCWRTCTTRCSTTTCSCPDIRYRPIAVLRPSYLQYAGCVHVCCVSGVQLRVGVVGAAGGGLGVRVPARAGPRPPLAPARRRAGRARAPRLLALHLHRAARRHQWSTMLVNPILCLSIQLSNT